VGNFVLLVLQATEPRCWPIRFIPHCQAARLDTVALSQPGEVLYVNNCVRLF
jgi:hypothetical protein